MKNRKLLGLFLVLLFVIILSAALYFAARNISYFDVMEVNISVTGQSGTINSDLKRLQNRLKGMNIFEISVSNIRNIIKSYESVVSVSVKRYFPSTLNIDVVYQDYRIRAYALYETGTVFYLADTTSMQVTDEDTFNLYSDLPAVELNPAYAVLIDKWGYDQGFYQMLELIGPLSSNGLITEIKYDNNNSNQFGLIELVLSDLNTVLYIREPVTSERLSEALELIVQKNDSYSGHIRYDLYSTALVKRK